MRQIILDTETTGLDLKQGHRIIEIGCLEMINRQLTDNHFHRYINPERDIDPGAEQVHGISCEFLADKPKFSEMANDFLDYIKGAELIIHNAPFDVGFLNHELKLLSPKKGKLEKHCSILDTLELARTLHPGKRNNLDALCARYQVDNSKRDLHGALMDAKLLAWVYLSMTAGQDSLFDALDMPVNKENAKQSEASAKFRIKGELLVSSASKEESQAHQDYLKKMKEKQGLCRWPD